MSFERSSCRRNHSRYSLCGNHLNEGHSGPSWQTCRPCREERSSIEDYVWRGTNAYNFLPDRLEHPPAFAPTHCVECGELVYLNCDSHTRRPGHIIVCEHCAGTVPPGPRSKHDAQRISWQLRD